MKQVIIVILISVCLFSCSNKQQQVIEGKWRNESIKKGCEINLLNGFYTITRWNDDLINTSKGKYFINKNQARINITLTLVPDLQYSKGDTIILPCENIDLVSVTDSILIVQNSTLWIKGIDGKPTKKNVKEIYRKITL